MVYLISILFCQLGPLVLSLGPPVTPAPLPEEARVTFFGSREDPPAEALLGVTDVAAGRSYLTGNEWNLQMFAPALADLGGGYVGVGSDQAWLLIGWQRPELAWLIDYDPKVCDVQRVHMAFFKAAPDYAAWRALWEPGAKVAARDAIVAASAPRDVPRIEGIYREARAKVRKRIDALEVNLTAAGSATFITDAATYAWVRAFVVAGRARPMVADLYGKRGLRGIAKAAAALNVPIRIVYLSNAEQYLDYADTFRSNISKLPHDDKSLVIRTVLTWALNQDYRYNTQPFANFVTWLAWPGTLRLGRMIRPRETPVLESTAFHFDMPPPAR